MPSKSNTKTPGKTSSDKFELAVKRSQAGKRCQCGVSCYYSTVLPSLLEAWFGGAIHLDHHTELLLGVAWAEVLATCDTCSSGLFGPLDQAPRHASPLGYGMRNQLLFGAQTAPVTPRPSEQPLLRNRLPSTWLPLTATKPQQAQLLLRVVRLPPDGTSLWSGVAKKTCSL
jgi:hypothetical protein